MTEYEARRAQHFARRGELLGDRMARLQWSREEIAAEQRRALRAMVAVAQQRSPWHAARLGAIDAATFEPGDLRALPTMTKADLTANFDDIVTDRRVTLASAVAVGCSQSHGMRLNAAGGAVPVRFRPSAGGRRRRPARRPVRFGELTIHPRVLRSAGRRSRRSSSTRSARPRKAARSTSWRRP